MLVRPKNKQTPSGGLSLGFCFLFFFQGLEWGSPRVLGGRRLDDSRTRTGISEGYTRLGSVDT